VKYLENLINGEFSMLDMTPYIYHVWFGEKNSFSKIVRISGATYNEIKRVIEIVDKSEYLRKWPVMF